MTVSSTDVASFRDLLARVTGLAFDDDKLPALSELLSARMKSVGSRSASQYFERLESAAAEAGELARTLCISETYFLRNQNHFRALETLLRRADPGARRKLRLLSAGCSSGEETYSLAMICRESLNELDGWTLSILGVDLNPDALRRARAGCYSRWSLRQTPAPIQTKYFTKRGAWYAVSEELKHMVCFEQGNLAARQSSFWRARTFDVIFLRNVLMYLTKEATQRVLERAWQALSPGGYLFLGDAESLRGSVSGFCLRHTHDTFYYQRLETWPAASAATAPGPIAMTGRCTLPADDASWVRRISRASARIETLSQSVDETPALARAAQRATPLEPALDGSAKSVSLALDLMRKERFGAALELFSDPSASSSAEACVLHSALLLSTGDIPGAERLCAPLLEADPLNAEAHYVIAVCREHFGASLEAMEHSRAAAYLDSNFAMPHLQLGRIARRSGDLDLARRELRRALTLLPSEQPRKIVLFGGGFNHDGLIQLCRGELTACSEDG